MTDADIVANIQPNVRIGMQYRTVLNIAVLANFDPVVIAPQDSVKSNAGARF